MSYDYARHRDLTFTEEGQRVLLNVMDTAKRHIDAGGSVMSLNIMTAVGMADTWTILSAMDRLIELDYMHEITGGGVAGQHRVFVAGRKWRRQ